MAPTNGSGARIIPLRAYLGSDAPAAEKILRLGDEVIEHTAAEREAAQERAAIVARVAAIEVLARANAQAQRATGDAASAMATAIESIAAAQSDHGSRLERIEAGVLEAIDLASRARADVRQAMASDLDLAQTVEREKAAAKVRDEEMRALLAPIVADTARKAGNAGATKTAGAISVAALAAGLAAQPVETVRLVREIGPMGLAIAVVLFVVVAAGARLRRS